MEQKRYPKGHFVGLGYAIGMPLCIVIGFVTDNISMGIVFGVALGVPIGAALEKKYNPNPKPLTEEEGKVKKRNLIIALGLGVVALIAGIAVFFTVR